MASDIPPTHHSIRVPSGLPAGSEREKLNAVLSRYYDQIPYTMPAGCNVEVMREGQVAYEVRAGHIAENAPQHWGSVSKPFTAECILYLIDRGYVNFEDDILKLCPELAEYGIKPGITIDNLLQMRSGLPDVWNFPLMFGMNPESFTTEELLCFLKDHPDMLYKPGTKYMYCNTNYFLLAKIVEILAKKQGLLKEDQTFVDFVGKYIFFEQHHMGARCSADSECPHTIDGYDPDHSEPVATFSSQSMVFGAHGVVGRPEDMVKWNAAIARGKLARLLVPPKDLRGKDVLSDENGIYCRGLRIRDMGNYRRISHAGDADGYLADFRRYEHLRDPTKTFALFLATNYEDKNTADLALEDMVNFLAGERLEVREDSPQPYVQKPHVCQDWVKGYFKEGDYICVDFGVNVHVDVKQDEKRIWQVSINPVNTETHKPVTPPLTFTPAFDEKGEVVWRLQGIGKLRPTEDGFICEGDKTGPVSFRKNTI